MPFRKTYQINNQEEGKAAQRDQSYRSCLIALLIFFFMCLILILACIPWKMQKQREYKDSYKHEQQYSEERTNEATIMTVSSITQRTPATERTDLSRTTRTRIIPNIVITSTTENRPTEDTNVITEDYSRRKIKGSHHFERYFKNTISVDEVTSTPVSEEDTENYTSKKVIEKKVDTTKRNISLTTSSHYIVTDNVIDNVATSISPRPIVSTTTKNTTIVDIIRDVITSKSANNPKEFINDSTNRYYSSNKLEVDIVTDNVITPTLLIGLTDLEENVSENFTRKYKQLKSSVDNITFSTTPSLLSDLEGNTSIKYSSEENNYSKDSQFEVTSDITILTQLDENRDENFTIEPLNYKESAATEYNTILLNETETRDSFSSTINYISLMKDEKFSAKVKNETEDVINETSINIKSYTTEKYNVTSGMEEYTKSSTPNYITTTTTSLLYNHTAIPVSYNEMNLTTTARITTLSDEDTSICKTGHCKQIASKMLSYMNHSADPCDDFYEYACGGFEANPQLTDGDLVGRARNYQRIANQMLKEKRENMHSIFATYYDSCVQYERTMNFSKRIRMASDALGKIGKFYILGTWPDNYTGFTNLFAQLILHHSALLFDIVPNLDEYRPNSFTLKIGPTMYESPFQTEYVEDPCFEDNVEMKEQYLDLEILYNNFKSCKNNTNEFMRSIRKALTELNVFKDLNDNNLEWNVQSEHIEKTIHVVRSILMQEYFSNFPSKSEIREAYLMNDYSKISLEMLQSSSAFINWTQLIRSLTEMDVVVTSKNIQVYFHAALTEGLRKLEEYAKKDPMGLNNAIMALYAHKLYHEMVLPKHDNVKDHCLHVATYLLQLEASSLYISSFTDHEIVEMNEIIEKTFNDLKQTLVKKQETLWAKEEGQEELLKKINSLKLALPVASYFKNRDSLYSEYNISEINLYDNYFNNSMILLKRYRFLKYSELRRQVGDSKQIWTYYATPFQSKAQVIYTLNLIVIPYGIIDWSLMKNELSFDYLLLATLGNLIAHQIAHHFDANGIHYWNQTKNAQDSLIFENQITNIHFEDYINCQKNNLYQESINMTLPFTDQTVSFRIPQLTLNERLSEIMGLRLAYDTLALRSDAKRLPWIQLRINQLFYLAYAQMYCTKIPLTSLYVSLHESEDLPSRIRVFVSASNDQFLAKEWNCPLGSQVAPNDVCSVFPYIETETKETAITPE